MAEMKTKATRMSVAKFIESVKNPVRKRDARTVLAMMKEVTGEKPVMWGTSIVGFGAYHYTYASGREGDWLMTGFSPRAQSLTVYIMPGFKEYGALLKKLGPHKTGSSCLYIKDLSTVDETILKSLIERSYKEMKKQYAS